MNMIEKRKAMAGQGGFTLIELLVVIAILAVLGGAAVIGIGQLRENAEAEVCSTDQDTLSTAAEAALIANPSLTLTNDDGSGLPSGYLKKVPTSGATVSIASGVVTPGGC
jgi:prepilin-type N-terminal cleavage/methylation domain-containing protein